MQDTSEWMATTSPANSTPYKSEPFEWSGTKNRRKQRNFFGQLITSSASVSFFNQPLFPTTTTGRCDN